MDPLLYETCYLGTVVKWIHCLEVYMGLGFYFRIFPFFSFLNVSSIFVLCFNHTPFINVFDSFIFLVFSE